MPSSSTCLIYHLNWFIRGMAFLGAKQWWPSGLLPLSSVVVYLFIFLLREVGRLTADLYVLMKKFKKWKIKIIIEQEQHYQHTQAMTTTQKLQQTCNPAPATRVTKQAATPSTMRNGFSKVMSPRIRHFRQPKVMFSNDKNKAKTTSPLSASAWSRELS